MSVDVLGKDALAEGRVDFAVRPAAELPIAQPAPLTSGEAAYLLALALARADVAMACVVARETRARARVCLHLARTYAVLGAMCREAWLDETLATLTAGDRA